MNAQVHGSDPLERARSLIESARGENTRLSDLAQAVGLSPTYLQRRFRARFGLSPAEYARQLKLDSLKCALRQGSRVTDAVYDAGFGSGSRVYEQANALLGMTPADYRRGGAGSQLRYTTLTTALGQLLVAATDRGICAVSIGNDDDSLLAELHTEFPQARIERVDNGRDEWLGSVIDRVLSELSGAAPADAPLPPFDLRATAFQWRVAGTYAHSTRRDAQLRADCASDRSAACSACGGARLRIEQVRVCGALPSRRTCRWPARWLALGAAAQASAAQAGVASGSKLIIETGPRAGTNGKPILRDRGAQR